MSKNRDLTFDIVRAVCILDIVCLLHLSNYIDTSFAPKNFWNCIGYASQIVLGAFAFISGYFLKKYKIETFSDIKRFYINRIKRFWILYFIASLTLYLASSFAGQPWYPSILNFVLSLFGLTIFFQPLPATLWYMVMIMFFYMITPIFLCLQDLKKRSLLLLVFYVALIIISYWDLVDKRVVDYFPMYALGLITTEKVINFLKKKPMWTTLTSCLLLFISFYFKGTNLGFVIFCVSGSTLILIFAEIISKSSIVKTTASYISYSSLNMYFFHRHFFLGFLILYNSGSSNNIREATFPIIFAYLIVCPCVIVFSYYVQKLYDQIIKHWWP